MRATARTGRTQKERRDETRRALLDATVDCLTELGYARTSTLEVQRRAGVSRGALLHHFPSKAELLVAAVEHLAALRGRQVKDRATALPPGGDRIAAALDLLWESFSGPLFYVAMELRTAARTDPELREALAKAERDLRKNILAQARQIFGADIAARAGFDPAIDMSLQLMIGAAMTAILHGDQVEVEALIEDWKTWFRRMIGEASDERNARWQTS